MWDNDINVGNLSIINYNIITNLDWVNTSKAKTRLEKKKKKSANKEDAVYIYLYRYVYYDTRSGILLWL